MLTKRFAVRAIQHSTLEPHIKGELVARITRGDLTPEDLESAADRYAWFRAVLVTEFRRVRGR